MQYKFYLRNGIGILMIFLLTQTAFGQKGYHDASIITLDGETIHGSLDYIKWQYDRNKLYFKEANSALIDVYTPADLKGYNLRGDVYFSAVVETEMSPGIESQFTNDPEVKIETEHVFLKVLVSGDKSLYSYKNSIGKFQFYILQDSVITLLIHKKYFRTQPNQTQQGKYSKFILQNRTYVGQLSLYLDGCNKLDSKIKRVDYSESSIKPLFLEYAKCKGIAPGFKNEPKKLAVKFGVTAGATSVGLDFERVPGSEWNTVESRYLTVPEYKRSNDIATGVFIDLILPWNLKRWSLSNELLYNSFQSSADFDITLHAENFTHYQTTVGQHSLKFSSMVRYQYPVGKFYPFINLGISKNIFSYSLDEVDVKSTYFGVETNKTIKGIYTREKLGLLSGIGVKYSQFTLQYRYESFRSGYDSEYIFRHNRQYILVSYTF